MKRILSAILVCILMVGCVFALASCNPNKDPEKAKEALEDAGYTVVLVDDKEFLDEDMEANVTAYDKDGNYISITYYADKDAAKEAFEEAEDELDDVKEYIAEILNVEADDLDLEIDKSGKMIWIGTKDAIKAAK